MHLLNYFIQNDDKVEIFLNQGLKNMWPDQDSNLVLGSVNSFTSSVGNYSYIILIIIDTVSSVLH